MKVKNCVLATLLLAIPSLTSAAGAEFDGKLYEEVKAKAANAAQSENVPAASKPAEVQNGNPANQKVNAFTVSDLAEIMNTEDYNTFLDSLVIREGKLICADNKTLWKYAENETIRFIGITVNQDNRNEICSKNSPEVQNQNKRLKNLSLSEKRNLFASITFVNGRAASWEVSDTDLDDDVLVSNPNEKPLWKHLCKQNITNGWKCLQVNNKTLKCYKSQCDDLFN